MGWWWGWCWSVRARAPREADRASKSVLIASCAACRGAPPSLAVARARRARVAGRVGSAAARRGPGASDGGAGAGGAAAAAIGRHRRRAARAAARARAACQRTRPTARATRAPRRWRRRGGAGRGGRSFASAAAAAARRGRHRGGALRCGGIACGGGGDALALYLLVLRVGVDGTIDGRRRGCKTPSAAAQRRGRPRGEVVRGVDHQPEGRHAQRVALAQLLRRDAVTTVRVEALRLRHALEHRLGRLGGLVALRELELRLQRRHALVELGRARGGREMSSASCRSR